MSREDLELESIIHKVIEDFSPSCLAFDTTFRQDKYEVISRAIANSILTWHKQREVELLEEIVKNGSFTNEGLRRVVPVYFIQKLIDERMVGKK